MSGFALGWRYLTGYSVATDAGDRDLAEWPPHPGRVFLALAAAHFESGEDPIEAAALRWLEACGAPELHLPGVSQANHRTVVKVYVPVNDRAGDSAAALQSLPALTRNRQERNFPCVFVGDEPCYMYWPEVEETPQHLAALELLARKVTRIGHSSSMVDMWAQRDRPPDTERRHIWILDDVHAEAHCRIVTQGTLDSLPLQTQIPRIERFAHLMDVIQTGDEAKRQNALEQFESEFGKYNKKRSAPAMLRPRLGIWRGFRRMSDAPAPTLTNSIFDSEILILKHTPGLAGGAVDAGGREEFRQFPVTSTLELTQALRNLAMAQSGVQPPPAWLSGHAENGDRLRDPTGHAAFVTLPFVGERHADGHVLGLAIILPRAVSLSERGRVLGPLLLDVQTGEPRKLTLTLGRLGIFSVEKCDWSERRQTLQGEYWSAQVQIGARSWATVTPIVLDRFPRADRVREPLAWRKEAADIIARSCEHIGLPTPVAVQVGTTSWHNGAPRAISKTRPVRGDSGPAARTALGDGFPLFPGKEQSASRPQVHAHLEFADRVVGPVILGSGRFLGYGLCKPISGGRT